MTVLRTPDDCFKNLSGFSFQPHYAETEDEDLGLLRIHFLDEGPADGPVVLCLHGEPTWCYLYRKMIPVFTDAGCRVLVPDLVGFGRSDKPARRTDYTYRRHVKWMAGWISSLGLRNITLLGQDFVKDGDITVGKLLQQNGASVKGFTRLVVGEGIEKKQENFADEVMQQVTSG